MHPLVPPEMIHSAAQMMIYLVTVVASVMSVMWSMRG